MTSHTYVRVLGVIFLFLIVQIWLLWIYGQPNYSWAQSRVALTKNYPMTDKILKEYPSCCFQKREMGNVKLIVKLFINIPLTYQSIYIYLFIFCLIFLLRTPCLDSWKSSNLRQRKLLKGPPTKASDHQKLSLHQLQELATSDTLLSFGFVPVAVIS